jgi:hypothetical protein
LVFDPIRCSPPDAARSPRHGLSGHDIKPASRLGITGDFLKHVPRQFLTECNSRHNPELSAARPTNSGNRCRFLVPQSYSLAIPNRGRISAL